MSLLLRATSLLPFAAATPAPHENQSEIANIDPLERDLQQIWNGLTQQQQKEVEMEVFGPYHGLPNGAIFLVSPDE